MLLLVWPYEHFILLIEQVLKLVSRFIFNLLLADFLTDYFFLAERTICNIAILPCRQLRTIKIASEEKYLQNLAQIL